MLVYGLNKSGKIIEFLKCPKIITCDGLRKVAKARAWLVDAPWKTSNLVCPPPPTLLLLLLLLTLVCSCSGQFVAGKIGFLPFYLFFFLSPRNTGNRLSTADGFRKSLRNDLSLHSPHKTYLSRFSSTLRLLPPPRFFTVLFSFFFKQQGFSFCRATVFSMLYLFVCLFFLVHRHTPASMYHQISSAGTGFRGSYPSSLGPSLTR